MKTLIPALLCLSAALLPWGTAGAESGFLDPMPAMQPDPEDSDVMVWRAEDFDRSKYDKVVIQPITIFISPKSEYQGINADEMKALSDQFRLALVQSLEPAYPVVDEPDARTLVARIAITDVSFKKKERGLMGYTPIGFVATSAMDAAGKRIELARAGIETELLDGASGKRLQATADSNPFKGGGKDKSWAGVEARLKSYAERFRRRMDEARASH
jgi:hypothetical protein